MQFIKSKKKYMFKKIGRFLFLSNRLEKDIALKHCTDMQKYNANMIQVGLRHYPNTYLKMSKLGPKELNVYLKSKSNNSQYFNRNFYVFHYNLIRKTLLLSLFY